MLEHVERGSVPRCQDEACAGLVKPDIVFFGEALPSAFSEQSHLLAMADLVLVIGTSLSVYPFAGLPEMARDSKPRVLFNLERVGNMGTRADDVLALGDCDSGIRKLADELGWRDELEELWKSVVGEEEAKRQMVTLQKHEEEVEEEVNKLTEEVEAALKIEDSPGPESEANAKGKKVDVEQPGSKEGLESTETPKGETQPDSEPKNPVPSEAGVSEAKPAENGKEKDAEGVPDVEKSVLREFRRRCDGYGNLAPP